MLINGVTVTVKVAHFRLCHSRMLFDWSAEHDVDIVLRRAPVVTGRLPPALAEN